MQEMHQRFVIWVKIDKILALCHRANHEIEIYGI